MQGERLEFDIDQSGAIVTVRLHTEEVSYLQMQELIEECVERMRCHHASFFVFDLSSVHFLCSRSLGAMVSFLQDLEHVRGRIALAGCQDNVAFLFKVTGLDAVISLFDDAKEAAESF